MALTGRKSSMETWSAAINPEWWNTRYTLEVLSREALNWEWVRPMVKNTKGLTISMPRSLGSNTQAIIRDCK